jgi:chemotaxis protein MotB
MKKLLFFLIPLAVMTSCVSKKKYMEVERYRDELRLSIEGERAKLDRCESEKAALKNDLMRCDSDLQNEKGKVKALEEQLDYFKATNTNLLERLSDLSIVSKSGAESIKKSLEALDRQNKYIMNMTSTMQRKDSLNLVLVMNLKRSLGNVNDEDVVIEVKKGVVYISISDKMLFKSGSSVVSSDAESVLGKIAQVVNDHKGFDILVEGHTDNVPISTSCIKDNWDLSAMRATSVVRILQTKYNVAPNRMTAGGRSEFVPKDANTTKEGKAANRRTEIIILPKLDEFFQLFQPEGEKTGGND